MLLKQSKKQLCAAPPYHAISIQGLAEGLASYLQQARAIAQQGALQLSWDCACKPKCMLEQLCSKMLIASPL